MLKYKCNIKLARMARRGGAGLALNGCGTIADFYF